MSHRPEKEEKYVPPVRFRIPGNLPAYAVLAAVSEALEVGGLELMVVREPSGMPYLNTELQGGTYTCILRKYQEDEEEFEPLEIPDRELTYDEKVEWFVRNHYETGMEMEIMRDSMRGDNLDDFYWYEERVEFPKMLSELNKEEL